jgi:hypothetical protein
MRSAKHMRCVQRCGAPRPTKIRGGGMWPQPLVLLAAHTILPSHSAPHAEPAVPCAPQYHGNCDAGPGCGLSHDLDLIVDIHENPGKWRKRKRGEDTPTPTPTPTPAPEPSAAGAPDAGTGTGGATGKDSRSKKRRLRRRLKAGATHGMCARRPLSVGLACKAAGALVPSLRAPCLQGRQTPPRTVCWRPGARAHQPTA